MKSRFDSEQEALQYLAKHQIYNMVAFQLVGTKKWGVAYPLECHVTVLQPHSPEYKPAFPRQMNKAPDLSGNMPLHRCTAAEL